MRTLRQGLKGKDVTAWQFFLLGQELYPHRVDGDFGPLTHAATIEFQKNHSLYDIDGIVGNKTYAAAMVLGFALVPNDNEGQRGPNWPPPPDFPPLVGQAARQEVFGKFKYTPAPVDGNPEAIAVDAGWVKDNIVKVEIPQLVGVKYVPRGRKIFLHKLAADPVQSLFKEWQKSKLMPLVKTWAGSWVPRFIRGSRTTLSNHAFGTAFDINVQWNLLGTQPALVGEVGSVRELVTIANDWGFYWGGHYGYGRSGGRPDGMHFEIARI